MKLLKKLTVKKEVDKVTGKEVEKRYLNFFVQADNGDLIAIRPATFKQVDGTVYSTAEKLSILAERIGG